APISPVGPPRAGRTAAEQPRAPHCSHPSRRSPSCLQSSSSPPTAAPRASSSPSARPPGRDPARSPSRSAPPVRTPPTGSVGEGVEDFAVGDEVLGAPARGLGAFAEHTVLQASETVAKPEEVSFADAATIPVAGTTAYDLTHQVELEAGQTLLVLGAGGGVG